MIKMFRTAIRWLRSDNRKSKIENSKLFGLSLIAFILAGSAAVIYAQQARIPRIGFLVASTASVQEPRLKALRAGLGELGFVEGQTIAIEYRYADGKPDR